MSNSIYCYFGGGRLLDPECSEVVAGMQRINLRIGLRKGSIIHVSDKKQETWTKVGTQLFEKIKVDEIVEFDPYKAGAVEKFNKLTDVQVFFIAGGMPDVFLNKMNKLGLTDKLSTLLKRKDQFVIGVSAGALMLNKICFISIDEDYPTEKIIDGLSIRSDFICEVHYETSRYKLLKTALNKGDVIAIEENSAIFIELNVINTVGKTYFYKQQNKT